MKSKRQEKILELIEKYNIETQEELIARLAECGIESKQTTVSRDIKELMLIKVPTGDGRYRYALPAQENYAFTKERMRRIFNDTIIDCDYSENILVVKTLPGGANTVAAALDYCKWPEIIGTVAGDDSILVVIKPKETASVVRKRILDMLQD